MIFEQLHDIHIDAAKSLCNLNKLAKESTYSFTFEMQFGGCLCLLLWLFIAMVEVDICIIYSLDRKLMLISYTSNS